ncbi:uncharacterized protein B0T15DRAFT_506677 [Chaetomium strumarium]|uniref:Uncharacterized protein n=1 Tax=Chaetomium strumarium TaxID=1170767 RepID=A0AAJ0H174_9PEZI|nr:hypothetical protein B0T15DRAFT_506677 [Chaetomium strumarium]
MKLQALALSLLAATGLATPVRRDVGQAVYTLRLSSRVATLDGVYLTTSANGSTLGVYPTPAAERLHVYPVKNPTTGLAELRTQGAGNTLAVVGKHGLLDFASLEDPAAVPVPEGGKCDWTSFRLDDEEQGGVLRYAGEGAQNGGGWAAFPDVTAEGGWSVKWKGGCLLTELRGGNIAKAFTTEEYMPVQVVYERVKDE